MSTEEYLTTDEFIDRINQLPKVFAIRSDMFGIDIYASWEEYRDDEKDCRWFMTIDPKATSVAQPFGDNFAGWPEEWLAPGFWGATTEESLRTIPDLADELCERVAGLIVQYIATPVEYREKTSELNLTIKEALLHQLVGALRDKNFNESYRNGRLNYARGVFTILGLEDDYEATVEDYKHR